MNNKPLLQRRCETCLKQTATLFFAAEHKTYAFCQSCHDELLELIESQQFVDQQEHAQ